MAYDFDRIIDRHGTSCIKYDFSIERTGRDDLLPMWVADMDFAAPECITEALTERVSHGIFGYTDPDSGYYDAMERWFSERYGVRIDRTWNTVTPGVVYAISTAIRAVTAPGNAVLIQEPVYYPFRETIEGLGRTCVSSSLIEENGRFVMDFPDLERKLADPGTKMMLLCSPHNPVGRVYTKEELGKVMELCRRTHTVLLSDEIHCDFIFPGYSFTSVLALEGAGKNVIVCTSLSKSFNLAGLQTANILIPDPDLRAAFRKENAAAGYSQGNIMGLTATKAAWENGSEWLDALLSYLDRNLGYVRGFLKDYLPEVRLIEPEGTYLLFLDFSGLVRSYDELKTLVRDGAHLWLDDGIIFGKSTELFERMNIACPESTLRQAMRQLLAAAEEYKKILEKQETAP